MSVVRAREAFSYTDHHGIPRVVRAGDVLSATDPDVMKRAHLFEPVQAAVDRADKTVSEHEAPPTPTVEQTTAEPGERRSVTTGRGRGRGRGRGADSAPETTIPPVVAETPVEGGSVGADTTASAGD
ncbi:MAG: hypothetical protein INR72_18055 [Williamsia herbipolensis]|nr:hypothetical protein [Williamsia herbipolensis]